jgi:hypothetical protein
MEMTRRSIATALVFAVAAGGSALSAGDAGAKSKSKPKSVAWFHYAVQLACGVNGPSPSVLGGAYATSANAHNAGALPATLRVNVALSYPPGVLTAGAVSDVSELQLAAGSALHVTCADVAGFSFATPPPASDYSEGMLVIESNVPLNVSAVYTAGAGESAGEGDVEATSSVQALQVVNVPERMVQRFASDKVTVCHVPPGNPANAHTIVVDTAAVPAHTGHGDTLGPCPTL